MSSLYNIKGKKILFIHIPKTGGSSIESVIKPYDMGLREIIGHQSYNDCIKFVEPDKVFTVVRNPWDWRSSWYHYLKKDKTGKESGHKFECKQVSKQNFNEHIKWLLNTDKVNFTTTNYHGKNYKLFIKSQSSYIDGCDDVDILRFENLENDFESFMSSIGLEIKLNLHINRSQYKNYKENYNLESINFIRELCIEDIKKFKYEY